MSDLIRSNPDDPFFKILEEARKSKAYKREARRLKIEHLIQTVRDLWVPDHDDDDNDREGGSDE